MPAAACADDLAPPGLPDSDTTATSNSSDVVAGTRARRLTAVFSGFFAATPFATSPLPDVQANRPQRGVMTVRIMMVAARRLGGGRAYARAPPMVLAPAFEPAPSGGAAPSRHVHA
eukprot:gene40271-58969_t